MAAVRNCFTAGRRSNPCDLLTYSKMMSLRNMQRQFRKFKTTVQSQEVMMHENGIKTHNLLRERPLVVAAASVDVTELLKQQSRQPAPHLVEEASRNGLSVWQLPSCYMKLSKYRLTALVVTTTLGGYMMAPGSLDLSTLAFALAGTTLCSASANTINQWLEIPYDSLMNRTKNRPLVRKIISPAHALLFGLGSGAVGVAVLAGLVNPATGLLGGLTILLYTTVYTPMKRFSIANTWVGAVVGAVPPVMGWTACVGEVNPGALVMAAILYAWQFPHFNALSWSVKGDYAKGGYKMMALSHPELCKRVALRYSLLLVPICTAAPLCDLTTWWFAADTLPVNGYLIFLAWKFYKDANFKTAKKLFYFSLVHLPLLMGFLFINKKSWQSSSDETKQI
uniref:Protoheme IX farnesyltransferase, mitochondrial n=1 Tax=Halisarca dujardinii TaxID=2583056 RepID=A0A5J6YJ41_HALDU|nr:protoheme IX farnesyltransferase [Halisarca dujardinii]